MLTKLNERNKVIIMHFKYRYLTWDNNQKGISKIKKILDGYSLTYSYKEDPNCIMSSFKYELEFFIYEDMDFFDKIKLELEPFDIFNDISVEYDKMDMENAEWYEINTGEYQYPQPDDDFEYLNYTFDLTHYCHECGIGKIQNNLFRLKNEPKQKNNQFWGLYWERDAIFIREETKNILEKENIKGIHFIQPVLHKSNKPIDRFYQLIIETELGKGLDQSNVQKVTCKLHNEEGCNDDTNKNYCGRVKYFFPKGETCIFDKKLFSPKIDFYITNEYFGSGSYAGKINIISKKVYEIIKNNKLKGLKIEPIIYNK
jgi:hypothetical protein